MNEDAHSSPAARISLLDFLQQHGWKAVRDRGRDEVVGLCPLHRDSRPSFYVNRRKQLFYCPGCGRGGGLARLMHLLGATVARGYLERLGYARERLSAAGLIDAQGRDTFFRCVTFPLTEARNLYGRALGNGLCRHRFLPGGKGGLYGWQQPMTLNSVIVVEGLFDLAALWQVGFDHAVCALGSHLNQTQWEQLGTFRGRIYICFDADRNGGGQRAAHRLSVQLRHAGADALRVQLPLGCDPASWFASGGHVADFRRLIEGARP